MKAIILARVSTKEQEEGHSIAAQRQRLVDYCARKGLDIIRTFEIVEFVHARRAQGVHRDAGIRQGAERDDCHRGRCR